MVRIRERRRTLGLDVARDDAVQRLALGLVVPVRRDGAALERRVNLERVLDDALRVHDAQLPFDALVNVVEVGAVLLFLPRAQQLQDGLVRLRRVRRAHGAELDAALLRATHDGVVAVADEQRRGDVPRSLLIRRLLIVHAHRGALSITQVIERGVEADGVQHRLFNHFFGRFVIFFIRLRERHGLGDVT